VNNLETLGRETIEVWRKLGKMMHEIL